MKIRGSITSHFPLFLFSLTYFSYVCRRQNCKHSADSLSFFIRTYFSHVFRPDSKEDRKGGEKKKSQIRPGLRNPPEVTQCSASGFNPRAAAKGKPIPYVEKSAGKPKHSRDESIRRCLPVAEVRRAAHHLPELLPHQNHHRKDHHYHHEDQHDEPCRTGRGDKMAGSVGDRRHVANSCSSADTDQLTAAAQPSNGLQGRHVST
jgi:hypothetical protein